MTDDDDPNLKYIKTFGNKYLNTLFDEEKKELMYGKKHIPIGRKKTGGIYYLDLEHACRILILGMTRSGKTFLLRELADRFNKAGYAILFLPDVKDEFKSSRRPVQEQFRKLLLEGEEPRPLNVVTFRPTFFKAMDSKLAKGNIWYSPHFANVTRADFMTLFNAEGLTVNQQVMLEMLYEEIRKNVTDSRDFSLDDIDAIIDAIPDLTPASKMQMKFKFRPFKTSHFYEKENLKSVVTAIQSGICPAINMEGFDNFGKGNFSYPEVVFSIVLRAAINARRSKKIPPLWVIVDEASRFIPKDQNPSCKRVVMESVDLDTRYEVNYAFAVQEISKMPEEIVKQCRYMFIPYSADVGTIKECLTISGMIRFTQTGVNEALRLKQSLKKYQWVVIDRTSGTKEIISPLAPLSEHLLQGD